MFTIFYITFYFCFFHQSSSPFIICSRIFILYQKYFNYFLFHKKIIRTFPYSGNVRIRSGFLIRNSYSITPTFANVSICVVYRCTEFTARSRSFAAFRTYSVLRGFLKKTRAYRPQNGGNAHILFPGSENLPGARNGFRDFFDERRFYPISFYPFCFYPIIFLRYISAYP